MFVFNVKINGSKVFKAIFLCMLIILLIILGIVIFRVLTGAKNTSNAYQNKVNTISASNYKNILKAFHDNIYD